VRQRRHSFVGVSASSSFLESDHHHLILLMIKILSIGAWIQKQFNLFANILFKNNLFTNNLFAHNNHCFPSRDFSPSIHSPAHHSVVGVEDALENATATPYPPRRSPTPPRATPTLPPPSPPPRTRSPTPPRAASSPPPPPPQASKKRSAPTPKASIPHPRKKQAQAPSGSKAASEKLPYEKTEEEITASVASDVKAHFAKCRKEFEAKRNPGKPYFYLPKGELRKRVEEHNPKIRKAQKPPLKSDYERQLIKSVRAQSAQKKAGKGVPQLGDTSRPLSPLIVADQYGSNVGVV